MTLVSEPVRLTGLLRRFLTEQGSKFDYQQAYVARIEALNARRNRKPLGDQKINHRDVLNWELLKSLVTEGADEEKFIQSTYNSFLKSVKSIIGNDELPTAEVVHTAVGIYNTLTREDKSMDEKRRAIQKKFQKTCNDKNFQAAQQSVSEIYSWKEKKLKKLQEDNRNSVFKEEEFGSDVTLEFRPFLELTAPDNFLETSQQVTRQTTPEVEIPSEIPRPRTENESQIFIDVSQKVDSGWLYDRCAEWVAQVPSTPLDPVELSATLESLLQSSKSDEELQNELFELLGVQSLEFIQLLLKKRYALVRLKLEQLSSIESQQRQQQTFTIQSKQEQKVQKQRQKTIKKLREVMGKMISQDDWISEMGLDKANLRHMRESELNAGPDSTIKEGVEREEGRSGKVLLPANAKQMDGKTFREVVIPAPEKKDVPKDELVPISRFEEWAQIAFKGIKHLNHLQSRVFESAYNSNTNLLVCAPTGAGKTNVAMMTMLREIGNNFVDGILFKHKFKIIYVAPMKALAAEMTRNFGNKLAPLGIVVKELTGDMQLSKKEIEETQIIITTPEKWDVITRKSSDIALTQLVRLLIIDEVHLLNEDRGPVIESLVARTLRQVEQSQSMIRIVGLSATLPNYKDVAMFLRVDPDIGLFYFGQEYRPVPLETTYLGVKGDNLVRVKQQMDELCFNKAKKSFLEKNQIMIFVHSRKDTANTAKTMLDILRNGKDEHPQNLFQVNKEIAQTGSYQKSMRDVAKSRNKEVKELAPVGFGIHHAGMLRSDRNLVEHLFMEGYINVLVCTATLAWGVNLPAHTVIIKGTQLYDAQRGGFVDLGILDVMQIFGRAGRPQFDTSGEAMIITTNDKLPHYLSLLTHQLPIESQFISRLADHLNAEIVLGTVTNMKEAIVWLSYTYLYIRMLKNPLVYGCTFNEKELDPRFTKKRSELIAAAARKLDKCQMIRYDDRGGNFHVTDLGRISSHFYIRHESIEHFNRTLNSSISDSSIFDVVAQSSEFENIVLREDEMAELQMLDDQWCTLTVKGAGERQGKVNILMQSFISKAPIEGFSLISDLAYVSQNVGRIYRALFEVSLKNGWTSVSQKLLNLCKMVDKRMWSNEHPLKQFDLLAPNIMAKLEEKHLSVDQIRDMSASDLGALVKGRIDAGKVIKKVAKYFPKLDIEYVLSPITRDRKSVV